LETWTCDLDGNLSPQTFEVDFCPHIINGGPVGTALCRGIPLDENKAPQKMNLRYGGVLIPVVFE
jgi:hypothetical protein